mmetsp:Transcript_7230/g.17523  ORF Transcript_7230/g.17523 Transcript_7230/m.17523 type:complete len:234 (+) Transcript_7230:1527-2228(+)
MITQLQHRGRGVFFLYAALGLTFAECSPACWRRTEEQEEVCVLRKKQSQVLANEHRHIQVLVDAAGACFAARAGPMEGTRSRVFSINLISSKRSNRFQAASWHDQLWPRGRSRRCPDSKNSLPHSIERPVHRGKAYPLAKHRLGEKGARPQGAHGSQDRQKWSEKQMQPGLLLGPPPLEHLRPLSLQRPRMVGRGGRCRPIISQGSFELSLFLPRSFILFRGGVFARSSSTTL